MSHSEQFWPFFLCFGLGSLIIVSNLALGGRLKFPDTSRDSGRFFFGFIIIIINIIIIIIIIIIIVSITKCLNMIGS